MLCRQLVCLAVKKSKWYRDQFRKVKDYVMGKIRSFLHESSRVVDLTGLYQKHLRDLMVWVENNVTPTNSTVVVERQVEVPLSASARKGIQPVVELFVDASKRTQILSPDLTYRRM
ncbi:hypothetical protein F25303_4356 [Fusarium sp. NRRL 25303]|nr:hypothetical protein F25303_4356 [Fusarium sp. NRRL 25303]